MRLLLPPGRGRGEGRRLFYTGDIRADGRKPGTFLELLRESPANVDVRITKGKNIRQAADGTERVISEATWRKAASRLLWRLLG
jgi:hypothetical protein